MIRTSGYTLALDGNTALYWLRLTYRLDYGSQRWDLFLIHILYTGYKI